MPTNLNASTGIVEPRFFAQVEKMTQRELSNRIRDLTKYLKDISPRVSLYVSLRSEREACLARLSVLQNQHGKA